MGLYLFNGHSKFPGLDNETRNRVIKFGRNKRFELYYCPKLILFDNFLSCMDFLAIYHCRRASSCGVVWLFSHTTPYRLRQDIKIMGRVFLLIAPQCTYSDQFCKKRILVTYYPRASIRALDSNFHVKTFSTHYLYTSILGISCL